MPLSAMRYVIPDEMALKAGGLQWLKRVIMPRENEPDLEELPPETREALEFVLVDSVEEVFEAAFDGRRATGRRRIPAPERQAATAKV